MQRQLARRRFNSQPVICSFCSQMNPNYRMFIDKNNRIGCFQCSTKSIDNILNIQSSFKEYYHCIINQLPLPDYKIAKECLESIQSLNSKANTILNEIRSKLDIFQKQLKDFFQQTASICKSYIDKVKNIEDSSVNGWHKHPPKLIDQEKFIYNIKQKHNLACKIEESLNGLHISIPNIETVKKESLKNQQRIISLKVSITAAIKVKGLLYQGTNDGRIIYQSGFKQKEMQAHDSLIRAFTYDNQFGLFSGSDDQKIKLWDLRGEQLKLLQTFGYLEGFKSFHRHLVIMDNGRSLASSRGQFDEHRIRVWDLQSFQNIKSLQGHDGHIKGMVGINSNQLVSVSQDRYLKIWDIKSQQSISQYFHACKINYVFVNNQSELICIIDEFNKVELLDIESLSLFNAITINKKIQLANAQTFIYVHADRFLHIYTWSLSLLQKIDLGLSYAPTNIIQMFSKLIVTDANGVLHQTSPNCLKNTSL